MSEEKNTDKYFFACVEYSTYDKYSGEWEKSTNSEVFKLDHYPTRVEIADQLVRQSEYQILLNIISYNELTKEDYEAYETY